MVIDDDEFIYLDPLRKSEYRIEHRRDIQSLKDVAEYDVILCDIRGVGKFLNSQFEGAYLVKQIKEKYPNKIVISYTANSYDPKFQEYLSYADATVAKYESEYVRAVKSGKYESLKEVYEKSKKPGKDIMVSLLSIVFKAISK